MAGSEVMSYLPAEGSSHNISDGLDYCRYSYDRLKKVVDQSGFQSDNFFSNFTVTCYLKNNNATCPAYLYELSDEELMHHLAYLMPPAHYEYEFVIPFAIIILSLVIFGFFGNLLTIIVILRNRVLQSTSHYLVSLAVSDILLLVLTGPTEVLVEFRYWPWTYTSFFCHARFFLIEFGLFTTVLHITAFTIERYVAICHPMKAKAFISTSRAIKFIIAIWITSFLTSIPLFVSYHLKEGCAGIKESTVCQTTDSMHSRVTHFYIFSATFLFLLPMTLIIVLYSLIARVLFGVNIKVPMRRSSSTKAGRNRVNGSIKAKEDKEDQVITMRKQVVKMLVVIAASFFICWCPFHLIRILPFFYSEELPQIYYKGLYHFSIVLLYVSSAINPILYNVMSARFRRAFKQTILCREKVKWESCMKSPELQQSRTRTELPDVCRRDWV